jgi:hypothetical protein
MVQAMSLFNQLLELGRLRYDQETIGWVIY